jgi:hypothetical protein
MRRKQLKKLYGLTEEDYHNMRGAQEGKCGMCGQAANRLVVDHNHQTGQVRNLLCVPCNGGLGWIERKDFVEMATAYLKRWGQPAANV